MENIGWTILAWFLNYGTGVVSAICAAVAVAAGLLCVKRFTTRRRLLSLSGVLAAEIVLICNLQFNMWLFDEPNKRAFGEMCASLKQEPIERKTKVLVAARFGKPSPLSRSRSNDLETWSYSPGPFLSYGGMDSICIEFKVDAVNRWYISWF